MPANARTWMDTLRTYARLYGATSRSATGWGARTGWCSGATAVSSGPTVRSVGQAPLYDEDLVVVDVDPERVRQARLSNPVLREEKLDLTVRETHAPAFGETKRNELAPLLEVLLLDAPAAIDVLAGDCAARSSAPDSRGDSRSDRRARFRPGRASCGRAFGPENVLAIAMPYRTSNPGLARARPAGGR